MTSALIHNYAEVLFSLTFPLWFIVPYLALRPFTKNLNRNSNSFLVIFFIGFFIGGLVSLGSLSLIRYLNAPLDAKIETLKFSLDENKVPLKDQLEYMTSPINKVRFTLAENKSTDLSVLKALLNDENDKVRIYSHMNLQKRNELPMLSKSEYEKLQSRALVYLWFMLAANLGLLMILSPGRYSQTLFFPFLVSIMIFGGRLNVARKEIASYRSNVFSSKIKSKTISNDELRNRLDEFQLTEKDFESIKENDLPDDQVKIIYENFPDLVLSQMKKRNLIKWDQVSPKDFNQ